MKRITYYDPIIQKYALLASGEEEAIEAIGKLEDSLEKLCPKSFGEYLRRLRQRHNMTQESFAATLHIKPITVKNIENGTNLPCHATLLAISETYDISVDNLRFALRRYAYHLKDEELDYMLEQHNDAMHKHIGKLLQCERRFMSISKNELGAAVGCSAYYISKAESGKEKLCGQMLCCYGEYLKSCRLVEVGNLIISQEQK